MDTILKRWTLILGQTQMPAENDTELSTDEQQIDAALGALYEFEHSGKFEYQSRGVQGGTGKSTYSLSKWLGDIRTYFPTSVVQVLQSDALKQPELQKKLMFEPEILEQTEPNIHLVTTILELKKNIPAKTKNTARIVVQKVVEALMDRLQQRTISAINGALSRSVRNLRPKYNEINWQRTIFKNLKHYQPEHDSIIPETKIGYRRKKRQNVKDIILCLDQSASMSSSIVYSGVFASVLASLPTIKTRLIAFDIDVADLSEYLKDPVELLFGIQLGGGTDINKALKHIQSLIEKPSDTILILISDLFEGGNAAEMQLRIREIKNSGVQCICLLTLSDDGAPSYDVAQAKFLAHLDIPVFACTPDLFPDLMAAAINGQDLNTWASHHDIMIKKT